MRFTDADLDGDGLLTLEEVLPSGPVVEEALPPTYYEHPSPATRAVPLSRCTRWSPSWARSRRASPRGVSSTATPRAANSSPGTRGHSHPNPSHEPEPEPLTLLLTLAPLLTLTPNP